MSRLWKKLGGVLAVTIFLGACQITPMGSSWDSPPRFTKAQVFNAALQSGAQNGMRVDSQDRESGTISLSKRVAKGDFILGVRVTEASKRVNVQTTGSFGGDLAVAGLHEEFIKNFHVFLFRILGISDPAARNISIGELK